MYLCKITPTIFCYSIAFMALSTREGMSPADLRCGINGGCMGVGTGREVVGWAGHYAYARVCVWPLFNLPVMILPH